MSLDMSEYQDDHSIIMETMIGHHTNIISSLHMKSIQDIKSIG